jgi:hypothetical protein
MLLIGFSWIIIACLAGMVVTKFIPGSWEDRGPTVIMLTAVGACFTSMIGNMIIDGVNGYGPPSTSAAATGVGLSVAGALVAFIAYAVDVRRQQQTSH